MAGEPLFQMEFGKMAGEDDEDVIVSLPGDTGAVITKAADAVVVKTGIMNVPHHSDGDGVLAAPVPAVNWLSP